MRFIDNMIVTLARCLLRGVMAAGTGLVYVQFFVLALLLAIIGIATLTAIFTVSKNSLLGI